MSELTNLVHDSDFGTNKKCTFAAFISRDFFFALGEHCAMGNGEYSLWGKWPHQEENWVYSGDSYNSWSQVGNYKLIKIGNESFRSIFYVVVLGKKQVFHNEERAEGQDEIAFWLIIIRKLGYASRPRSPSKSSVVFLWSHQYLNWRGTWRCWYFGLFAWDSCQF